MNKQDFRRATVLEQAADVLKALAEEGMIEAQHGIGMSVDSYLKAIARKVQSRSEIPQSRSEIIKNMSAG